MKLLIVDDEAYIVDWLFDLLHEQFPELTVRRAYSGIQAMHILENEPIDLLVADIQMPRMTGIQLMEQVCKNWPKCRILFLTGFGEFDYVYTAIQKKGVRYLLKTEDDAVIVRTVREMLHEIMCDGDANDRIDGILRREQALNALLGGALVNGELLNALGLQPDLPVWLLYIRVRDGETAFAERSMEKLIFDDFGGGGRPVQLALEKEKAVWMIQSSAKLGALVERAERFCGELKNTTSGTAEVVIRAEAVRPMAIGRAVNDWIRVCSRRAFAGGVIASDSFNVQERSGQSKLENQRRRTLIKSMEFMLSRRDEANYLKTLEEVIGSLEGAPSKEFQSNQAFFSIMLQLQTYAEQHDLASIAVNGMGILSACSPDCFSTCGEAFEYLRKAARTVLNADNDSQESQKGMAYRLAEYVDNHLEEELSLTALAELMHYNASYLSRAFKEQMGINLNKYILQARMRSACMLLEKSNDRIGDIAAKVGFHNSRHFAKVFQQNVGLAPQTYRDHKRK